MLWKTKQFSTQKNLFINHSPEFNIKELFNLRVQSIWKSAVSFLFRWATEDKFSILTFILIVLFRSQRSVLDFLEMVLYKYLSEGHQSCMIHRFQAFWINFRWHFTFSFGGSFLNKNFGGCWQCIIGSIWVYIHGYSNGTRIKCASANWKRYFLYVSMQTLTRFWNL